MVSVCDANISLSVCHQLLTFSPSLTVFMQLRSGSDKSDKLIKELVEESDTERPKAVSTVCLRGQKSAVGLCWHAKNTSGCASQQCNCSTLLTKMKMAIVILALPSFSAPPVPIVACIQILCKS